LPNNEPEVAPTVSITHSGTDVFSGTNTLSMVYSDSAIAELDEDESLLRVWRWDDEQLKWVDAGGDADTLMNTVTAPLTQVGTYGVFLTVSCDCPFQSDFDEDGFRTPLDLSSMIDILYAGDPDVQDIICPSPRADFDCDGFSTPLDLGGLIDYLFASGPGPCDPCAP
jgi:hypothetical protein